MSKGYDIPSNKHLGNNHDYWRSPQKNSKQIIIQHMNWIKVSDRLPDLDIIILGYSNGTYYLVERYGEYFFDTALNKVDIQYWCEITPPSKI